MYIFFKHPILLDVFSVYKQILVDHNSFTLKKKKKITITIQGLDCTVKMSLAIWPIYI